MKIIICADSHIGQTYRFSYNQQGISERSDDLILVLYQILEKAKEITATGEAVSFIFAGDLYGKINVLPYFRIKTYEFMREIVALGQVDIIAGNHDSPRNIEWLSSLDDLTLIDSINLHKNIEHDSIGYSLGVLFVPFISPNYIGELLAKKHEKNFGIDNINDLVYRELKKKIDKETEKLSPCKRKIAIVHFPITGMSYAGGHEDEDFILPAAFFDAYDLIIAGHIHRPSSSDKLIVVGSTEVIRRDEIEDQKRFLIIDSDTGDIESIPLKTRQCVEINVEYDGNDPLEFNKLVEQAIADKNIKNSIVYLVVQCPIESRAFLKGQLNWDIFKQSFHTFLEFSSTDQGSSQPDFQEFDISYTEALSNYAETKIQDDATRHEFIEIGNEIIDKVSKTYEGEEDNQ